MTAPCIDASAECTHELRPQAKAAAAARTAMTSDDCHDKQRGRQADSASNDKW